MGHLCQTAKCNKKTRAAVELAAVDEFVYEKDAA
jgi:hypothetical protein